MALVKHSTENADHIDSEEKLPAKIEEAKKRTNDVRNSSRFYLDLSRLSLNTLPVEVNLLSFLKTLYLTNNYLTEFPDETCKSLINLRWLDLRSNRLMALPGGIKHMKYLHTLLLDDNRIRILPLELGLLENLTGLHVGSNPLEFPHQSVIHKGTSTILRYLYDCYLTRERVDSKKGLRLFKELQHDSDTSSLMVLGGQNNSAQAILCNFGQPLQPQEACRLQADDSWNAADSWDIEARPEPRKCNTAVRELCKNIASELSFDGMTRAQTAPKNDTDESDLMLAEALNVSNLVEALDKMSMKPSDELYDLEEDTTSTRSARSKSTLYREIERNYLEHRRYPPKPHSGTLLGMHPSQSERHKVLLPDTPPQPTLEKIHKLHVRGKKRKARKLERLREESVIQQMKDKERVQSWKQEYLQQQKAIMNEYMRKPNSEIEKEAINRILNAPFDVAKNDTKVMKGIDLVKLKQTTIKPPAPPPNLDQQTVLALEVESMARDRRLADQVKRHASAVAGRLRAPLPAGSKEAIRDELLAAKRDVDMAVRLHNKVQKRLETLNFFRGSNRRDLW